jgi:DNA-binding transcriptional MocR family regulator
VPIRSDPSDCLGNPAVDLVCRFLLRPGDVVLVDDPCYFNFHAQLRAHQARIVGVPCTRNGPDAALFAEALTRHRPRLYITNSALHNPTGVTMSLQTAYKLLSAAAAHDVTIVEDDIFAGFEPESSPRLAILDGLSRVIRNGSFSKTLSASIRCGYLAARPDWVEALVDLQVATNFGDPSPVAAELVFATLSDGSYRKHLDGLLRRLTRVRRETADKLEAVGLRPWLMPYGGFFLWCSLSDSRNAADLTRAVLLSVIATFRPVVTFKTSQSAREETRGNREGWKRERRAARDAKRGRR